MQTIAFQPELCPALPVVVGNVDYQEFRTTLLRIDELLRTGDLERAFVQRYLREVEGLREAVARCHGREHRELSPKAVTRIAEHAVLALRCTIAHALVGDSYRGYSRRLADSPLLQRFCGLSRLDVVRVPGKSALERYGKLVPMARSSASSNRSRSIHSCWIRPACRPTSTSRSTGFCCGMPRGR